MTRRYAIAAAALAALLLVVTAAKIQHAPWSTPAARAVEQRGPLSDAEKATIDIFERVSPSVVQVAVKSAASPHRRLSRWR
jgi:2-alkenal reductase